MGVSSSGKTVVFKTINGGSIPSTLVVDVPITRHLGVISKWQWCFTMGQPTSAFLQREFVSQLNGKTMLKPVTSINDLAVFNIRADTLINSVKSVLSRATLLKRRSYVRKYAIVTKYPFSIEAVRSVESLIFRSAEGMLGSSLDHSGVLVKPAKYLARLNKSTIRKVNTTLDDSVIL